MRKLLLFPCFMTFLTGAFSQQLDDLLSTEAKKRNAVVLKQIDSMYKVLPILKREELANGLLTLSNKFLFLPLSKQVKADSTNKYLSLALTISKKIGYKKGMALAYAKLSGIEIQKNDAYWENNKKPNDNKIAEFLDAAEALLRKAIDIGESTNNNMILGGSYWSLAGVVERRVWNDSSSIGWQKMMNEKERILRKAIYYTEKQGSELTDGSYRDLGFLTCAGCTGNERWLGGLYRDVAVLLVQKRDYKTAIELNKKSISYYKKGGEKALEGYMHNAQANIHRLSGDITAEEESFKSAVDLFSENTNPEWENNACIGLVAIYLARGEFEKSFPYCERSLKIMEALDKSGEKGTTNRRGSLYWMGRLYKVAGDHESALQYMRQAWPYYAGNKIAVTNWKAEMGDLFTEMGNYDSAMYYLGPAADPKNNYTPLGKRNLGILYISLKEFDKALPLLEENVRNIRKGNDLVGLGVNLTALAKAYAAKKQNQNALSAATEGLAILKQMQRRWFMVSSFEVLSDIYQNLGKYDSAVFYLRMHTRLKDSILSRQFYWRLNTLKKQSEEDKRTSQINLLEKDNLLKQQQLQQQLLLKGQNDAQLTLLDKDNEIKEQQLLIKDQELKEQHLIKDRNQSQLTLLDKENKLKDQRLKQQATIRNALLAGLLLFLALGILIFRSLSLKRKNERLQNEKRQAELQQKAAELEMQALRAQMNPHFIFNCLSSINKFILKNDTDTASDYLTRFSRLIRQSLTNSQLSLIPLSDEIEMLRLYLDMERLRFSESFNYNIIYENTIEPETIYIPPMLLQPFCENAIWHGLMHKEGPGKLDVIMSVANGELQCIIADNGIGREKAAELKSTFRQAQGDKRQKSFGLKITTERLALFNDEKSVHSFYKTEDVLDPNRNIAGTKVIVNIKFRTTALQSVKELYD